MSSENRERAPVVGDRFLADNGGAEQFERYEVLVVEGASMLVVELDARTEARLDRTRWLPCALFTYAHWFVLRDGEKELSL